MSSFTNIKQQLIYAYAHTKSTNSIVLNPCNLDNCNDTIKLAKELGLTICNRGGGFSNYDVILNDRNIIVNMSNMNKIINWNPSNGVMIVEPGVLLKDIFFTVLLDNWFLPSCPGGMYITVGGAVSNNIHGKDSFQNGNFGDQVINFKLLTANSNLINANRVNEPDLFNAIIGGMGLLGIITEITLQMKRTPSAYVEEICYKVGSLKDGIALLEEAKYKADFALYMIDSFAKNKKLGRGQVFIANWVNKPSPVVPYRLNKALTTSKYICGIPAKPIWRIIRPIFGPLFMKNAYAIKHLLTRSTNKKKKNSPKLFPEYNFRWNKLPHIHDVYLPEGKVELQPLIPYNEAEHIINNLLVMGQRNSSESIFLGLKNHRKDDYLISYCGNGISFGIELQLRNRNIKQLKRFSEEVFNYTIDFGGKVYLAKDELLTREYFKKMYPNYKIFKKIKNKIDSDNVFISDIYRRLF